MMHHPTIPKLVMSASGKFYLELEESPDVMGYAQIRIQGKGRCVRERVHRLVWEIMNGMKVPHGMVVRHLNDDKTDNRIENLEAGSQAQNILDAVRNGKTSRGARNRHAKIKAEPVIREIRQRREGGETLRTLADEYGLTVATICDICKRRTWAWVE